MRKEIAGSIGAFCVIATPVSVHCINLPVMFVLFKKVAVASLTDVRVGILCKHIGVTFIFFFRDMTP